MPDTLIFDIETHSADLIYTMTPRQFVRIAGYKWAGDDEVQVTTDLMELRDLIYSADFVIGHNIHSFDLPAVFGLDSLEPVHLADEGRIFDTWTHAALCNPCPPKYTDRHGRAALGTTVEQAARWFSLDEQAHQLGVMGKTHDLKALAREFGDPSLKGTAKVNDGFGKIPLDDPRYLDYLAGDVIASEVVARMLLARMPLTAYAMREQKIEARKQVISSRGFRIDVAGARKRAADLEQRKAELVTRLAADYGFPATGKKPWATDAGKTAILAILADHGITSETRPKWTRTKGGYLSFGAKVIQGITKGTDAEELGISLAELQGQRNMAQTALDNMHPDGKAHTRIMMLQRTGRWSTKDPGLTVYSEHDEIKRRDKEVYLPDDDESVLIELDYSDADSRIVAALSGDLSYLRPITESRQVLAEMTGEPEFENRFKPGKAGGHAVNAVLSFGIDVVKADPDVCREKAKRLGHAWNYGAGPVTLSNNTGLPLEDAKAFCSSLARAYPLLTRWQERAREQARRTRLVTNPWGRRMRVDKGREYTQGPAYLGQSGTREVVCDALLRLPDHLLTQVRAQVHDALVFSVRKDGWEAARDEIIKLMVTTVSPPGGQPVKFPVKCGPAASNWADAGH